MPTGTPTEIPEDETVLLAGGGLGNAVLFSIAAAMKKEGNRVIYFAGYRRPGIYSSVELSRRRVTRSLAVDEGPCIPTLGLRIGPLVATSFRRWTDTPAES